MIILIGSWVIYAFNRSRTNFPRMSFWKRGTLASWPFESTGRRWFLWQPGVIQSSSNKLRKDARGFPQRDRAGCLQWAATISLIAGGCPKGNRVGYVMIQNIWFWYINRTLIFYFMIQPRSHIFLHCYQIITVAMNCFCVFHDVSPPPKFILISY